MGIIGWYCGRAWWPLSESRCFQPCEKKTKEEAGNNGDPTVKKLNSRGKMRSRCWGAPIFETNRHWEWHLLNGIDTHISDATISTLLKHETRLLIIRETSIKNLFVSRTLKQEFLTPQAKLRWLWNVKFQGVAVPNFRRNYCNKSETASMNTR